MRELRINEIYSKTKRGNIFLILFISIWAMLFCGCTEIPGARFLTRVSQPTHSLNELEGDGAALATATTVAILPFENISTDKSFNSLSFSTKLASRMATTGKLKVVYPQKVLQYAEKINIKIQQHNDELKKLILLGKDPAKERANRSLAGIAPVTADEDVVFSKLNPIKNQDDAIKLGRLMGVDVVLMGEISDYDPYYRPRMTVVVKAISTGNSAQAADELARLTQWGVPQSHRHMQGVVWLRQQGFDTRDGNVARDLYLYARAHHTENHPYDTEIYMRSMDRFYEFVGATLANKFLNNRDKAIKIALEKAKQQALRGKRRQQETMSRIKALVERPANLPSEDEVMNSNILNNRNRAWRPDVYGRNNPNKNNTTPAEPTTGMRVK